MMERERGGGRAGGREMRDKESAGCVNKVKMLIGRYCRVRLD